MKPFSFNKQKRLDGKTVRCDCGGVIEGTFEQVNSLHDPFVLNGWKCRKCQKLFAVDSF